MTSEMDAVEKSSKELEVLGRSLSIGNEEIGGPETYMEREVRHY